MIMHAKGAYLIFWTFTVLIDIGGYCLDKHECLTWEINSNLLTLICRLKHFFEPVILIDNHEREYVRCSFTDAKCFPRHKSNDISIDNFTNTVTFTIEDIDKNNVDGKWKCKQGKTIYETGVSKSKGIINATYLRISGEIVNAGIDSQVVQLTCHSCREPRKNIIEFLINGSSIDSISYTKNTGYCIHKKGNCKPHDCSCRPSGNEFTRLFPVSNVNVTFSCYTSFLDNDTKSIFALSVTTLFDGKVFLEIGSDTKVIKPPAKKFDEDKRNKSASSKSTNIKNSGDDSKKTEIPVAWIIVGVSTIVVSVPPVILLIIYVRRIITLQKDPNKLENKSDQTDTIHDDTCSDTNTANAETQPLLESDDTLRSNKPGNNSTLDNDKITLIDEENSHDKAGQSSMNEDIQLDTAAIALTKEVNQHDRSGQSSMSKDEKLDTAAITLTKEANPRDKSGQSSMSKDEKLDTAAITLTKEPNPRDKSGQSSMSEDDKLDTAAITLTKEGNPRDKSGQSAMSEDDKLDAAAITLTKKANPCDKSGQSSMSKDEKLDTATRTLTKEANPRDKSGQFSMSEDEKLDTAAITLTKKANPRDKSGQSSMSKDEKIDTAAITLTKEANPREKSGQSSMSKDENLNIAAITLSKEANPRDKSGKSSMSQDIQLDTAAIGLTKEVNPRDKSGQSSMSEDEKLDTAAITFTKEANPRDKSGQSSMSEDEKLDTAAITLTEEANPPDKSGQSSINKDEKLDTAAITLTKEANPRDKSGQASMGEDIQLDIAAITLSKEVNPRDKSGKYSMSQDIQLDTAAIGLTKEVNPRDKSGQSSMSNDEKLDTATITLTKEANQRNKSGQSSMSEDEKLDTAAITLTKEANPRDKSGQSSMSKDEKLDTQAITLTKEANPRDKSGQSSMSEDIQLDTAAIIFSKEDNSRDNPGHFLMSEDKPMNTQKNSVCDHTKETTMIDNEPCYETTETALDECEPCEGSQKTAITKDTNTKLNTKDDQADLTKFSQYNEVINNILNDRDEHPKAEETAIIVIENEERKAKHSLNKHEDVINETILSKNEDHEEALEVTSFVDDKNLDDDNAPLLTEEINTEKIERNPNSTSNECEPCRMSCHLSIAAQHWCNDCEEALCSQCKLNHSAMKKLKSHIIVKITSPSAMFRIPHQCENHQDYKYEYFCSQHRSLCCTKCVQDNHHGCKNLQLISEVSREVIKAENLDKYIERLKTLSTYFDNLNTFLIRNIKKVEDEKSIIKSKIQQAYGIGKENSLRKKQLYDQAKKSIQRRLSNFNEQILDVSKCKTLINQIADSFKSISTEFSAEKLYRMVHTSLKYFDSTLTKIISESNMINLEVVHGPLFRGTRVGIPEIREIKNELPRDILSLLPAQIKEIKTKFLNTRSIMW